METPSEKLMACLANRRRALLSQCTHGRQAAEKSVADWLVSRDTVTKKARTEEQSFGE